MVDSRFVLCVATLSIALVLMAGSCGDPDSISAPPTSEPPSSSMTTTSAVSSSSTTATSLVPLDAIVFTSYKSALDAFNHALADPPNPDDPLLAQTMVDPMLGQAMKLAGEWRGFGQAGKAPPDSVRRITLISSDVDGDRATIEACSVDDGIVYEPATGTVLNDKVTTAHDRATLTLVDGIWKLATREQVEKWEGVAGCALDSSA